MNADDRAADRDPKAFVRRQLQRRFQGDRVKAMRMVAQEIAESIARCEALESAVEQPLEGDSPT